MKGSWPFSKSNFDWDNDGIIRIISSKTENAWRSGDDHWSTSRQEITADTLILLDIQMIKNRNNRVRNNNVVIYLETSTANCCPSTVSPLAYSQIQIQHRH